MVRSLSLIVALALLTAGLAGCLRGPEDGSSEDAEANQGDVASAQTSGPTAAEEAEDARQPLTFPESSAVEATVWANGSFSNAEGCIGTGCITGDAFHQVELDDELADEAPTRIEAQLTHEPGQDILGNPMYVHAYSHDGSFYNYTYTQEGDTQTVQATVLKGSEPVVVEVVHRGPSGPQPEAEYTLRVDVKNDPAVVPAGVPVAVPADPEAQLVAQRSQPDAQGTLSLLAYGPEDRFLGDASTDGDELELGFSEATGSADPVLLAPEDTSRFRLSTNGSGGELRPLHLGYSLGEPHTVQGNQPVEWSFEADTRPLAVGIVYRAGNEAAVSSGYGTAQLEGPEGYHLEATLGCGFCLGGSGFTRAAASPIGADLAAGSYQAIFEPGVDAGTEVTELVVGYER